MLSIEIEKEIREENKVLTIGSLSLNARQTVCMIIGMVIAITWYLLLRDWVLMVIFTLPFALLLLFFAREREDGKKAEEVMEEKMEAFVFKNGKRKYRTRNQYVTLLNRGYRKLREADENDIEARREKKRREKERRRKRKEARLKEIA